MRKKLSDTTTLHPLGHPTGQRLLRLPSGPFAGRLVAIYLADEGELRLAYADPPATSWSAPLTIADDIADLSYDCCIDQQCNIQIAYLDPITSFLKTRKLTYTNGSWTVGDPVIVYSSHPTLNPSIVVDPSGTLWLAFNRLINGDWFVQLKSSTDSGATWGTGATDPGETLSTASTQLTTKLIAAPETLHAFIAYANSKIVARTMPYSTTLWSEDFLVASALTGFGHQFDAALGPDGRLAIAYNDSAFRVREFDGLTWSAPTTLDSSVQQSPQVVFRNTTPIILWLQGFNFEQRRLLFSSRQTGTYSAPTPLDPRADLFDSVLLYNHAADTYADLTAASSDPTASDIYHPSSGALFKNAGDALFVGMKNRFRYLHILLTTLGAGGTVTLSFWNGHTWVPFMPSSGSTQFDSSPSRIALWTDYQSIPLDWQMKLIADHQRYWVRVEVASEFSTGPIAGQITAISELQTLIARR